MSRDDYQHLYNRRAWKRLRASQLSHEPTCRMCKRMGYTVIATVADHIVPHRGDSTLFFDSDNLQSLCKTCHDGAKHQQETSGTIRGCDKDGVPIDPKHHWGER